MTRAPLLLLAVALVAGLAWWLLAADDGGAQADGAVVRLAGPEPATDPPPVDVALTAPPAPVVSTLEVDADAARLARLDERARQRGTRRRVVQALLRWEDGAPLDDALVDLAVGPFRTVHGGLQVRDPPAARSDDEGRLRLSGLYGGLPHLAIVQHAELAAPAGVTFEAPAPDAPSDEPLELVVPRPSTLVVEGLDPSRPLPVRVEDAASGTVLLYREPRLPDEAVAMTIAGLPRGQPVRVTLRSPSGGEAAWAEARLDAAWERVTVLSTTAGDDVDGPPLAWRLVDERGEPVSSFALRAQGLPATPELWITGSEGRRRTVSLEASGIALEGALVMQELPPWTLELQLAGARSRLEGVLPDQVAELVLPAGLLASQDRLTRLRFHGRELGLAHVELIDAQGRRRVSRHTAVGDGGRQDLLMSVPPGRYEWFARSQDRLVAARGRLDVFERDAGATLDMPVIFQAPGRLEGRLRFVGAAPPPFGSLTLVPDDWRAGPELSGSGISSDGGVRVEHLAPGSYRMVADFPWEDQQLSVDLGPVEILPGQTTHRDLTVPVDVDPSLRELAVLSRRGERARLVFSAPDGRRQHHHVFWHGLTDRLRDGVRLEDLRSLAGLPDSASATRLLEVLLLKDAPRLLIPPGFDRYEAWVQDTSGWWSSAGRLDLESGVLDLDPAGD